MVLRLLAVFLLSWSVFHSAHAGTKVIDVELGKAREEGIIVISNEGTKLTNIDYDIEAFKMKDFGTMAADKMAEGKPGYV